MGVEVDSEIIVIGDKKQMLKFYNILGEIPNKNGKKHFRDNKQYADCSEVYQNGVFEEKKLVFGETDSLDEGFVNLYFVAVHSTGYNGSVYMESFLSANDISYKMIIESEWADTSADITRVRVADKELEYDETVPIVDENSNPDSPMLTVEPSKQVKYGLSLLEAYQKNEEVLKNKSNMLVAVENLPDSNPIEPKKDEDNEKDAGDFFASLFQ